MNIWNNRTPAPPDDGSSEPEPTTVRDAQHWLYTHGFSECTEDNAKAALFMRRLVREGRCNDDKR